MVNGAMLLPEFDSEVANTRRMFAAIPDEKLDFKPHEKSSFSSVIGFWVMRASRRRSPSRGSTVLLVDLHPRLLQYAEAFVL